MKTELVVGLGNGRFDILPESKGSRQNLSPFPGALYALLDYLGDHQDYDYLMGITGAAFRRLWNRDDGGNVDLSRLGDVPSFG